MYGSVASVGRSLEEDLRLPLKYCPGLLKSNSVVVLLISVGVWVCLRECRFDSGIMMLEYEKAVQQSVYEQLQVVHEGRLKVFFTRDLKLIYVVHRDDDGALLNHISHEDCSLVDRVLVDTKKGGRGDLTEAEVGVGDFIELKVTDCVQTKKKLKLVISLKMDLSDYEVPRVLVTCRRRQIYDENDDENVPLYYHINKDFSIPFGREEFCLVTGLRFGVQNWAEYDTKQRIPFRRRVFPSYLDGQPITGIDIANMINDEWNFF
ncbi:phospholipase-like protein [Tanacetum coccineum]